MFATTRKSPTARRNCCRTFSEKRRTRAALCTVLQASRSGRRLNWKSFSKWRPSKSEAMGPAEFYDSLISGGTFAVRNTLACSDEYALGILGDLQGRQIITIEPAQERF